MFECPKCKSSFNCTEMQVAWFIASTRTIRISLMCTSCNIAWESFVQVSDYKPIKSSIKSSESGYS